MILVRWLLSAEDDGDSGQNQIQFGFRQLAHTGAEQSFVKRDDLRDVRNRVFWQ